jgi:hypothetical protein
MPLAINLEYATLFGSSMGCSALERGRPEAATSTIETAIGMRKATVRKRTLAKISKPEWHDYADKPD